MEDFVNSLSLFGDISLPRAVAQTLVDSASVEEFNDDDLIINLNDAPGKFYIIEEGAVKVFSDYNLASRKFEGTVVKLKKSGHFGEQVIYPISEEVSIVICTLY